MKRTGDFGGKKNKNYMLAAVLATLLFSIVCVGFAESASSADENVRPEVPVLLEGLDAESTAVMKELLSINTHIDRLTEDLEEMEASIAELERQIGSATAAIQTLTERSESLKVSLKTLLVSQQQKGATSFLDVLFNSKDLGDLFDRLNLLRDLNRTATRAMDALESSETDLEAEQVRLKALKASQVQEKEAQELQLQALENEAARLETYLESLEAQRSQYEAYMAIMEQAWEVLHPVFSDTISEINRLIAENALPDDAVRLDLSISGAKAYIDEMPFNETWASMTSLPKLNFQFTEEGVVLEFEDYEVVLQGNFELIEDKVIRFNVDTGTFMGIEMDTQTLEALFSEGDLVFDLTALLGRNGIESIVSKDGYLEMEVVIRWF